MSASLNAKNKPGWFPRLTRGIAARLDPETYEQTQGMEMTQYGMIRIQAIKDANGKVVRKVFGEINSTGNQFIIERPGAGVPVNPSRALEHFTGFVYAAVNAKAREVMTIDWRLFSVDGEDTNEQTDHPLLDLLDSPNDNMNGLELKYLTSACLDLTGNTYWWLDGVKNETDKPKNIHLMPPDRVRPVIDRRVWPHKLVGYKMKLENREMSFEPYEIVHFRGPNPSNFFEGYSPVMAGAAYIDNDNDATRFNSNFFRNGARPAGFLESDFIAETQLESLRVGFADMHGGIENMNRIAVLPKGVKWSAGGATPKDMDFSKLSIEMKDRILSMFGASKTILGTAESDTNRATAETADYVFSKRVVKPHMIAICGTLNDRLVGRYADEDDDNLYVSFIDPVPEDKAARTTEMQTSVGGQPVLTVNEARDEFMGLGPVKGGDVLMAPTAMAPVGSNAGDGKPESDGDVAPQPQDDPNAKFSRKSALRGHIKAANGINVGWRPARSKFQRVAKKREASQKELAERIAADLKARLDAPSKKFQSTKEQDEARWKEFSDFTEAAEKDIAETVRKINAEQKQGVMGNLESAITKAISPGDLFDIKKWISITTDALTPVIETLFEHQAVAALAEIGKPDIKPFTETTREAVQRSVQMMSESYQQTTLETLASHINDGLQAGESLADITKRVEEVYEFSDASRAAMVAKTESFRTANSALKSAWQQSGVVKTVRWYTANDPCPFCQTMEGKTIPIDDVFLKNGESVEVDGKSMTLDYGDVGAPPLHPNCLCMIRPEQISLD